MLEVPVVLVRPGLPLPEAAREGDAGYDLRARSGAVLPPAGGRAVVPTGVRLELPPRYAGLVLPRSGLAASSGVTVLNAPGLIDSGYRGEVAIVLVNTDRDLPFTVSPGDRVAQLVVVEVASVSFVLAASLSASARGEGGFGHSGLA